MENRSNKTPTELTRLSEEEIVDRIYEAIIEQRLPPGTKLSESALCEAFGAGRMRIRRSLLLLASRDLVDLQSNRGAYVASPTSEQARDVFEARRSIEPSVIRMAVERASPSDVKALERNLALESQANRDGDRRQAIRLSGEFHVKLAETANNHVMCRMVKELVSRTSLIIGMFGSPGTTNCLDDEHAEIMATFRKPDPEKAARLMTKHLEHIEAQIDLTAQNRSQVNLVNLFGSQ